MFLAIIGLENAQLIQAHPTTLVQTGLIFPSIGGNDPGRNHYHRCIADQAHQGGHIDRHCRRHPVSIANGISIGIVSYVLLRLVTGKTREIHPIMAILTLLLITCYSYRAIS